MERQEKDALLRMFAYGALEINAPAHGKPLPFTVRMELLDCIPSVRESVIEVLSSVVKNFKVEALAAVPGGCRALVPILAHQLKLTCILPATATPDEFAAVIPYGPDRTTLSGMKAAIINEYVRGSNPVARMYNALTAAGCEVKHALGLLDADRDGEMAKWVAAGTDLRYQAIYTMEEIFMALSHDSTFSGVAAQDVVAAAQAHYRGRRQSVRP